MDNPNTYVSLFNQLSGFVQDASLVETIDAAVSLSFEFYTETRATAWFPPLISVLSNKLALPSNKYNSNL